ncbi:hypothetical protein COCOBI_13-0320 [Coccomyxa sp. Obi]|nr:hypothetical protein COCOBI_13-0320 [Coccomyxa sp. Obi]
MGGVRASILAWVVLSLATQSIAAVRIFAYFNNNLLPGDQGSSDGSYELMSYNFGVEQAVSASSSPIAIQGGKARQGAVNLIKQGDEWDPNFERLQLKGPSSGLNPVVISTQDISGAGNFVPIFNITLNNVYITSNRFTVASGNQEIVSISLDYAAITATYFKYDASGALTTKTQTGFNFVRNVAI